MVTAWTGSMSGYVEGRQRAQQVRKAHIQPPDGTFPRRSAPTVACGQHCWDVTDAPRLTVPFDQPLPDGVTWCAKCVGVAADHFGLTPTVLGLVAARAA